MGAVAARSGRQDREGRRQAARGDFRGSRLPVLQARRAGTGARRERHDVRAAVSAREHSSGRHRQIHPHLVLGRPGKGLERRRPEGREPVGDDELQAPDRFAQEVRRGPRHLRHTDARIRGRDPRCGRHSRRRNREAARGAPLKVDRTEDKGKVLTMTGGKLSRWWPGIGVLLSALAAAPAAADSGVALMHVHGLSYSADGKQLFIPSHVGMAIYSEGRWSKAPGPEHDFMGFSATREALYSSGHPAPGSSLRNPFGLLKSGDGGKSWEHLGLTGEADFHVMAASYGARVVYVYAAIPNSRKIGRASCRERV